ncbi:HD domain-containing protein [Irregularibacter muris]|uniref:HD domain-containing protein n=1 Tax=Irregularibacter muris TaxID=1796619 RepID=A0AAE3HDU2_9FIRM|nr:HD domain-containing protein [Irregularibacter muris]MCR1898301.1 HD domain-containing protein [Irregularibacter muris]
MLDREKGEKLLHQHVITPHILKHSYAVESVMRALARRLEPESEDLWGLAGLLHDLDNDLVDWQSDMSLHGPKTVELLRNANLGNEEMYQAILAHNPATKVKPKAKFERALYAGDPITGFITAIALVYPSKQLKDVKVKSITKRMKEVRFAAGANREAMASIEMLDIPFPEFAELSLNAMREISEILGL